MRWIVPMFLLGCAGADPVAALPTDAAPPPLTIAAPWEITPGVPFDVEVNGANPGARVGVGATLQGTRPGAFCPAVLQGTCLDLISPRLVASGRADANGFVRFTITPPANLPVGGLAILQAATPGGVSPIQYASVLDPNCPQIVADFQAETAAIRSCQTDAECGQVLQGTSCGCTRDWVARIGANTRAFYDLLQDAGACGYAPISTCDCPQTFGFVCDNNVCSWDYTP